MSEDYTLNEGYDAQRAGSDRLLRSRSVEWTKKHYPDEDYPWIVVAIVDELQFIKAHCFHEADADRIIADHTKAALAEDAVKALAGWLVAACANCTLSIAQVEPGNWIHIYGPMIGRGACNQLHGAESDLAVPDEWWAKRRDAAVRAVFSE